MFKLIKDLFTFKFMIVRKSNYYYYKKNSCLLSHVAGEHYWFTPFNELKPIWEFVLQGKDVEKMRDEYIKLKGEAK